MKYSSGFDSGGYIESLGSILKRGGFITVVVAVYSFMLDSVWAKRLLGAKRCFHWHTKVRSLTHEWRFDYPADPYETIHLNPENLDYKVRDYVPNAILGLSQLTCIDWNVVKINKTPTYRGLIQRFDKGYDWPETEYPVPDEYDYRDDLFEKIKQEGYQPNYARDVVESRDETHLNPPFEGDETLYKFSLEPMVVISSDGSIYLREGQHRVIFAKILGIDNIPVHVMARDKEWQKRRDKIATTDPSNLSEELRQHLSHPDIQMNSDKSTTLL